jgi:adenylate kinase
MILTVFGPPGSGRGKIGRELARKLNLGYISSGEIFLKLAQEDSFFEYYTKDGKMIPDGYADNVMLQRLSEIKDDFLIVGYPYTVYQAQSFDKQYDLDAIVRLALSENILIRRLVNRVVCSGCFASFNLVVDKPGNIDTCDYCGAKLVRREDDNPKRIKERLETYNQISSEVLEHYSQIPIVTHEIRDPILSVSENASQILDRLADIIKGKND